MKKFKIVQIYLIEADDAYTAVERFSRAINPVAFLDGQFVKEADDGWKSTAKKQIG
jgi:hypothetical protein